ncbi:MAG: hypothetical protein HQM15_07865 [Deltaproteobacteria bacterium]|nr:hypothetical protein [Deltaproteobacteria bacterium]
MKLWDDILRHFIFGHCVPAPAGPTTVEHRAAAPNHNPTPSPVQPMAIPPWLSELRTRMNSHHDQRLGELDSWLNRLRTANEARASQDRPNRHLMFSLLYYSLSTYVDVNRDEIPWGCPSPRFYLQEDTGITLRLSGHNTQFNPQNTSSLSQLPIAPLYSAYSAAENTHDSLFLVTHGVDTISGGDGYAAMENGQVTLYKQDFWDLLEDHVAQNLDFFIRRNFHFTQQDLAHFLGTSLGEQVLCQENNSQSSACMLSCEMTQNHFQHPVTIDDLADELLYENHPHPTPLLSPSPASQESGILSRIINSVCNSNDEHPFDITRFFSHIREQIELESSDVYFEDLLLLAQGTRINHTNFNIDFDLQNIWQSFSVEGNSALNWDLLTLSPDLILGPGGLRLSGEPHQLNLNISDIQLNIDPLLTPPEALLRNAFLSTEDLQNISLTMNTDHSIEIAPGIHVRRLSERYPLADPSPHAVLEVTGNLAFSLEGGFGQSHGQLVFAGRLRWDAQGIELIPGETRVELHQFHFNTPGHFPQFLQFDGSDFLLTDLPHLVQQYQTVESSNSAHTQNQNLPNTGFLFQINDRGRRLNTFLPMHLIPDENPARGNYYRISESFNPSFHANINAMLNPGSDTRNFDLQIQSDLNSNTCSRDSTLTWLSRQIVFSPRVTLESGHASAHLNLSLLEAGLVNAVLDANLQGVLSGPGFNIITSLSNLLGMNMRMGSILRNNRYEGTLGIQGQARIKPETYDIRGAAAVRPRGNIVIRDTHEGNIPVFTPASFFHPRFYGHHIVEDTALIVDPRGVEAIARPTGDFAAPSPLPSVPGIATVRNLPLTSWRGGQR